ncbi:Hypothetical protein DPCES_5005 [Desulfitobacterium hafniense]|uniref:Uncharacterized protein n=1 Tax=Desulfitobacterium hafniense TaxID=49338 RepID=A0A098BAI9_DESHA|nr:hypothetical protein [Desulfitobacterium hafniense]CDX04891.1 Hypothetical protein DPCES_5005 [Desulfitobacterium hafniense]
MVRLKDFCGHPRSTGRGADADNHGIVGHSGGKLGLVRIILFRQDNRAIDLSSQGRDHQRWG